MKTTSIQSSKSVAPETEKKKAVRITRTKWRHGLNSAFITVIAAAVLFIFLAPFAFMILTSLKTPEQISIVGGPIWPAKPSIYQYNGKDLEVFTVPVAKCAGFDPSDSSTRNLALAKKGRQESTFVDPNDAGRGEFTCAVSWRALERPWMFSPTWANYQEVWNTINYPRLMWNTTFYAIMTELGVLISCTLVAFGFARFRFPGRDFLFIVLISTIFLPAAVTVIPTYTFWQRLGAVGSW